MLSNLSPVSLLILIRRIIQHISVNRRYQFIFLLVLTLASSLAEVVSLGSVVPFIGIITQPEEVIKYRLISVFVRSMDISNAEELILPVTIVFAVSALIAGGLRLLLLWIGIRLANSTGADLSIEVYRRTLYQPYRTHVTRNSSEIISGITQKVSTATGVLVSLVTVVTSAVLFTAILITLLLIDPLVATIAVVSFGTGYGIIAVKTRDRLKYNSRSIAREQTQVVKALQEGLGAIRDVLLDGTQAVYCDVYRRAILQLQRANGENSYINQAPRFAMETLGIILIAVLALVLGQRTGGVNEALPVLGALALGAQRLLPLLQQLYGNWAVVTGSQGTLNDVIDLLDQPLPEEAENSSPRPYNFMNEIRFDDVCFHYDNDNTLVLKNFNLNIKKGSRIGFIGSTGSGKSTVLDLLMGLLDPTSGRILVDGSVIDDRLRKPWQQIIAHVPQNIFLADLSMAENIALGVPPERINPAKVRQAAALAQISEFIESRPSGYQAVVGERGIRISGGQRQRIGIARALYKDAKILVFDEATSALDTETEEAVMNAIENLNRDLTILIIAHRLSTLRNCDIIVRMEQGSIIEQGHYDYFSRDNQAFSNRVKITI